MNNRKIRKYIKEYIYKETPFKALYISLKDCKQCKGLGLVNDPLSTFDYQIFIIPCDCYTNLDSHGNSNEIDLYIKQRMREEGHDV